MLGLIGKKIGMSRLYSEDGIATPVTLVQLYDTCVSDYSKNENGEFSLVTVSFDPAKKADKVAKPQRVMYEKKNLSPYRKSVSFKIPANKEYKIGDKIGIDKISKGDFFNIQGTSKGKGFAGGMKRWNFSGLEASHGVSVSHRALGSTGHCTQPGRTFKGKKMPGQMGNKTITVKNLEVLDVNTNNNVICIKGAIPGHKDGDVILRPSNI